MLYYNYIRLRWLKNIKEQMVTSTSLAGENTSVARFWSHMIHRFIGVSGNGEHPPNGNLNAFRMTRNIQKPVDFSNPETPNGNLWILVDDVSSKLSTMKKKLFDKPTWMGLTKKTDLQFAESWMKSSTITIHQPLKQLQAILKPFK